MYTWHDRLMTDVRLFIFNQKTASSLMAPIMQQVMQQVIWLQKHIALYLCCKQVFLFSLKVVFFFLLLLILDLSCFPTAIAKRYDSNPAVWSLSCLIYSRLENNFCRSGITNTGSSSLEIKQDLMSNVAQLKGHLFFLNRKNVLWRTFQLQLA